MISVNNLLLHFGERPMFDNVSFFIGSDDRIGLVGRNGAGKSTLLKILAGQQHFDKGNIGRPKELTMGYLPQQMDHDLDLSPWQVAEKAFEEAQQLNAAIDRITADLETAKTDEEAMELATLLANAHERLNTLGVSDHEMKIERMLKGALSATVTRTHHRDGLEWRFEIPVARLRPNAAKDEEDDL